MATIKYANKEDLIARYGQEIAQLSIADGKTDTSIDSALEDGAAEINGYVGRRYKLPLPAGKEYQTLKWLNCVIARYRLWESRIQDSEDNAVYVRYRQAVAFLKDLAEGKANLLDEDGQEPESWSAQDVMAVKSRRPQIFTNNVMRRMDYGH
ncbi:MAG: DUF1320 family protein [Deltaproteobacteria bacterium]|jgi:phage gp36-like protein|nr:DUF1320 family protein [Deltaproteobacteria bacterium]